MSRIDPTLDEVGFDGVGAVFTELVIAAFGTAGISMADDADDRSCQRTVLEAVRNLPEVVAVVRAEVVRADFEVGERHADTASI